MIMFLCAVYSLEEVYEGLLLEIITKPVCIILNLKYLPSVLL